MPTFNHIIKEIKDVPVNRLDELYQFVQSLTPKTKHNDATRKKILSFGGAFNDMTEEDYEDFLKQTTQTRQQLFDRNITL